MAIPRASRSKRRSGGGSSGIGGKIAGTLATVFVPYILNRLFGGSTDEEEASVLPATPSSPEAQPQGRQLPPEIQELIAEKVAPLTGSRFSVPPMLSPELPSQQMGPDRPPGLVDRHLDEAFMQAIAAAEAKLQEKHPGWKIKIREGYRTPEEQFEHYKAGRTRLTGKPGSESAHQQRRAADIYVQNERTGEINHAIREALGELIEAVGLEWGGRYKNPREPWHIALPGKRN